MEERRDLCQGYQVLGVTEGKEDKSTKFWMNGVMDCLSNVMSIFSREDNMPEIDDGWEVPFENITEMTYLGAGAQGVVYRGLLRGEMVAVKKLRDISESNIDHLRKLNHENIVKFKGVCTQYPNYSIIMEYCQYGPLNDFLHSGVSYSPRKFLKWAKDIAHGMAYLHSHNIIHRDLKSPNILVADDFVVKLTDFGTSREWYDGSILMTFTGTVAWMAPEVIRHEPCSDRIDVWSYGVVLWELLTMEVPYRNLEANSIIWGVGTASIALPIPTTCPDSIRILLTQCWNRVPKNRPPFKIILAHLEIASEEIKAISDEVFTTLQEEWRCEMDKKLTPVHSCDNTALHDDGTASLAELRLARRACQHRLNRANNLYMEVCAVRLQLEQREKAVSEREEALNACRCGVNNRKNILQNNPLTSSSDNFYVEQAIVQKKQPAKQILVNFVDKPGVQNVSFAINIPVDVNGANNKQVMFAQHIQKIDTVVEYNGNLEDDDMECVCDENESLADDQRYDVRHEV